MKMIAAAALLVASAARTTTTTSAARTTTTTSAAAAAASISTSTGSRIPISSLSSTMIVLRPGRQEGQRRQRVAFVGGLGAVRCRHGSGSSATASSKVQRGRRNGNNSNNNRLRTGLGAAAKKNKKKGGGNDAADALYRADRVLSNRSGLSRSECFALLRDRRVHEVVLADQHGEDDTVVDIGATVATIASEESDDSNGIEGRQLPRLRVVPGPSAKLRMDAPLRIDRETVVPMPPPLLMVYHKPKWVLSVRSDPRGRPCLNDDTLPAPLRTESSAGASGGTTMHPVGRLDYDTSGLLLFSGSGTLTQTLLHPKHSVTKEYVAVVVGAVDDVDALREQLEAGVATGEGVHTATLLDATPMEQANVQPYLSNVRDALPPEYNRTDLRVRGYLKDLEEATQLTTVRLVVSEGKHRMVRRVLANCGYPVISLKRERLGEIVLDDEATPEGTCRELTQAELSWAESLLPTKQKKGSSGGAKSNR